MGRVTIAQPSASFDAEGRVGQYIPRRQKSVKTSLAVTAGAPSTSEVLSKLSSETGTAAARATRLASSSSRRDGSTGRPESRTRDADGGARGEEQRVLAIAARGPLLFFSSESESVRVFGLGGSGGCTAWVLTTDRFGP